MSAGAMITQFELQDAAEAFAALALRFGISEQAACAIIGAACRYAGRPGAIAVDNVSTIKVAAECGVSFETAQKVVMAAVKHAG